MNYKIRTLTKTQLSILTFIEENGGVINVSPTFEFQGKRLRCDILMRLNSWGMVHYALSHQGYNCRLTDLGHAALEKSRTPRPRPLQKNSQKRRQTRVSAMPFTYAISTQQPWASAIIIGQKPVENRLWAMPERFVGVPMFLHAGMATPRKGKWPEELFKNAMSIDLSGQFGGIIGWVIFGQSVSDFNSPWAVQGYWHWPVLQAQRLDFFPCKGKQKIFRFVDYPTRGKLIEAACASRDASPDDQGNVPLMRPTAEAEYPTSLSFRK